MFRPRTFDRELFPISPTDRRRLENGLSAYAETNGIRVPGIEVHDVLDLKGHLGKIVKAAGEKDRISIYYEKGKVGIERTRYLTESGRTYFLPLIATYVLPDPAGTLARRFLRAFDIRFNIGVILDTPRYEFLQENTEICLDELKEDPDDLASYREENEDLIAYMDGCLATERLRAFETLPPATREEAEAFIPEDETQGRLKDLILEGFSLIGEDGFNIWDYAGAFNGYFSQEELDEGYIAASELFAIVYDYDGVLDAYIDGVNSDWQGGLYDEPLLQTADLVDGTRERFDPRPARFMEFYDKLISLFEDIIHV